MKNSIFKTLFIAILPFFILFSCNKEKEDNQWNSNEASAVKSAILDYVEGIYEVDSTRIEKSVDTTLRKIGY